MIHIAICDDETKICGELEQSLIDIFDIQNIKYEIDVFFTGEELKQKMESGFHFDLIFLDIEFANDEVSGIDIGHFIRNIHHNYITSIVFISWEKKYALQLFDVQPLNFLVKPIKYEKLEKVVKSFMKLAGLWTGVFTYKIGPDTFKVQTKNIAYLENRKRKVILHLSDGRKEDFYGSLKDIYEEQLKDLDFLFIHASYVVNYDYITALMFNQVSLIDIDTPLPISKHRTIEVREHYYKIMNRRTV